jgi:hypothetical protein
LPRCWPEDNERIPLVQGKMKGKPLILGLCSQNWAFQVIDSIRSAGKFRYSFEQRNFGDLTGELNRRTAELQRKASIDPAVAASRCSHVVGDDGDADGATKSLRIVDPD